MKFKRTPWEHQSVAILRASALKYFALFFEQGTGKTATNIHMFRDKYNQAGRILRTIIFTLPLPIEQWRDEWKANSDIDMRIVVPLYGSGAKRLKTFLKGAYDQCGMPRAAVFITNYESLLMDDLFDAMMKWECECIAFDESHKVKSPSAQRSIRAVNIANPYDFKKKCRKQKPFTVVGTGTPILNSPQDLFQQFKVLDGGETFGFNYYAFRAIYFRDRNAGMAKSHYFPKWEIMTLEKDGRDALKEIQDKMADRAMRVEKKDCLDLPPEVNTIYKVGMSPEQTRLYDELKTEFVTYYKSKACVATLAITKALRLMQITSGFLSTETPGEENSKVLHPLPGTPKIKALEELLQEICVEQGQKVLVWAVFKQNYVDIKQVFDKLKIKYVEVHGGISATQKRANVDCFKNDPSVQGFLGHPGSGGVGLNLTAAAYSIFYSRTFSLEHYLQARARNHRGGSKEAGHEKITHYDLVCGGTIDEVAVKMLANKQDLSDKLLSELVMELGGTFAS